MNILYINLEYILEIIFFISIFLIFYTYFLYPAVLMLFSFKKTHYLMSRSNIEDYTIGELPLITMVISAYNEEKVIKEKLINITELEYPKDKLEVVIASDGSTDQTNSIIKLFKLKNLKFFELPRMGKVNVLNKIIPKTNGSILVFSDANTIYNSDALNKLIPNLYDPTVGCVCGRLKLINPNNTQSGHGESFYWLYETWIKKRESKLGCVVGANGAIYAIRKSLFDKMPSNTINDDFHISMKILEKGYKVIYESKAIGIEKVAPDFNSEFLRHVRDGAGHYREIAHLTGLLNPMKGISFFSYVSHRFIRWLVPFLLPVMFFCNLLLIQSSVYMEFFILQLLLYIVTVMTYLLQKNNIPIGYLRIPLFFFSINLALLIGFIKNITGQQDVIWTPTER